MLRRSLKDRKERKKAHYQGSNASADKNTTKLTVDAHDANVAEVGNKAITNALGG